MRCAYLKLLMLAAVAFAPGCSTPVSVSVQRAAVAPQTVNGSAVVSAVKIQNRAPDAALVNDGLTKDALIPVRTDPPTKKTVEEDIGDALRAMVKVDPTSPTSLYVKVLKAEAYWAMTLAERVPFVSLLTLGSENDYFIIVSFVIEVEQQGKVRATYSFDEKISVRGTSTTDSSIKASYEKLIAAYRQVLQKALQDDFIQRYL